MTRAFSSAMAPFFWLVIIIFALLPIAQHEGAFFLLAVVGMIAGVAGAILNLPQQGNMSIPKSPFLFCLGGFWVVMFVAVLTSDILVTSWLHFCFLSMLPLSFIFVALIPDKEQFYRGAFMAGAAVYAALSLFCVWQYFAAPEMLKNGLTYWPMRNPNSLGAFLSLGFFPAYGAAILRKRAIFYALALVIFAALLTTGSRGAVLSLLLAASLLVTIPPVLHHVKLNWGKHVALLLGCVVLVWALSFAPGVISEQTPVDIVSYTVSGVEPALGGRPDVWASSQQIIREHVWSGTGPGTFFLYYPQVRAPGETGTAGEMAHNDLLQFWMEMGVFAPVFFILALVFAAVKTARTYRDDPVVLIPFAALFACVLHSQITFNFYNMGNLFMMGTLLGFWFWRVERTEPSLSISLSGGRKFENQILQGGLCILLLCTAFLFTAFQGSEILIARAKASYKGGNVDAFERDIADAITLSFGQNGVAYTLAGAVAAQEFRKDAGTIPRDQVDAAFRNAEYLLQKAIVKNPLLAPAYTELAMLYNFVGRDGVEGLLRTSLHINPTLAGTRFHLMQFLIRNRREGEALDIGRTGLDWPYEKEAPLDYYRLVMSLAEQAGDNDVYRRAEERYSERHAKIYNDLKRKKEAVQ